MYMFFVTTNNVAMDIFVHKPFTLIMSLGEIFLMGLLGQGVQTFLRLFKNRQSNCFPQRRRWQPSPAPPLTTPISMA